MATNAKKAKDVGPQKIGPIPEGDLLVSEMTVLQAGQEVVQVIRTVDESWTLRQEGSEVYLESDETAKNLAIAITRMQELNE